MKTNMEVLGRLRPPLFFLRIKKSNFIWILPKLFLNSKLAPQFILMSAYRHCSVVLFVFYRIQFIRKEIPGFQ